jgi:hypothetical protein
VPDVEHRWMRCGPEFARDHAVGRGGSCRRCHEARRPFA